MSRINSYLTALLICTFLLLTFSEASAQIYKWVDKDGNVHFADSPAQIPKEHREGTSLIKKSSEKPKQATDKTKISTGTPAKEVSNPPPSPPKDKTKKTDALSPTDPSAVELEGPLNMETNVLRLTEFTGKAINLTSQKLDNVIINISISGSDGKKIDTISSPVIGKKGEGSLEAGESGSFAVSSEVPQSSISKYEYKFTWKHTTTVKKQ